MRNPLSRWFKDRVCGKISATKACGEEPAVTGGVCGGSCACASSRSHKHSVTLLHATILSPCTRLSASHHFPFCISKLLYKSTVNYFPLKHGAPGFHSVIVGRITDLVSPRPRVTWRRWTRRS